MKATLAELGIRPRGRGRRRRAACPRCARGDRDDALSVDLERGAWRCYRCGWTGRVDEPETHPGERHEPDPERERAEAERKRERLRRAWCEAVELVDAAARQVRTYLASRGLAGIFELESPPPALRAHAALDYWLDGERLGAYPAMLAVLTGRDGAPATLHATYLRPDGTGKLEVRSPKKLLPVPEPGATRGGAIRLYAPTDGVLGIAEGIESALSLRVLEGISVWAASSASALERVWLPGGLRIVYVGVDPDEAGEQAATALAARLRRCRPQPRVLMVRSDAGDLNDELGLAAGDGALQ